MLAFWIRAERPCLAVSSCCCSLFWSGLERHGLVMHLTIVSNVVPACILGNSYNSGKLLCFMLDYVICILNNLLGVTQCKPSSTGTYVVTAVNDRIRQESWANLSCKGCHWKAIGSRIWFETFCFIYAEYKHLFIKSYFSFVIFSPFSSLFYN